MPAGDLITADWQVEIAGLLTGVGTSYHFGPAGISGLLGVPDAKTADVELDLAEGAYAAADYLGPRIIIVEYEIEDAGAAEAFLLLADLAAAWAPSLVDIELHGQLPGVNRWVVNGRPRGLEEDLTQVKSGYIHAVGEFHALDPTVTLLA